MNVSRFLRFWFCCGRGKELPVGKANPLVRLACLARDIARDSNSRRVWCPSKRDTPHKGHHQLMVTVSAGPASLPA